MNRDRLHLPTVSKTVGNGAIITDSETIPIKINKIITDDMIYDFSPYTESELKQLYDFYKQLKEIFKESNGSFIWTT